MSKLLCADLFCGGGGTSTGMIAAFEQHGIDYELVGVNHWDRAIETNNLNHRGKYFKDDIHRLSPRALVPGGRLHILWASPECTNHSRAKGGRTKDEQSRATAWDVLKWPQELLIDRIYIENVEEFTEWAPLLMEEIAYNGKKYQAGTPDPRKKGEIFRRYIATLKAFGYRVDWQIMNAADYGAPTCRRRLIIQAVRGKGKIRWPEPTHTKDPGLLDGIYKKWVPARDVIDFGVPGKSIFGRKKPLAPNTLRRIYAGIAKNGGRYKAEFAQALKAEIKRSCEHHKKDFEKIAAELPKIKPDSNEPKHFITVMRGTSAAQDGASVKSLDAPLLSISTNEHEGMVSFVTRYNGGDNRNHTLSLPVPVVDCSNRYALVQPFVFAIGHTSGGSRSTSIHSPISTVVTKAEHCLVEPLCVSLRGTCKSNLNNSASCVSEVLPTVTAGGTHLSLAVPLLIDMTHPAESGSSRIRSAEEQLPTITTRNNLSLASPFILNLEHTAERVVMRPVDQPLRTVTCQNKFSLVEPLFIPQHGGGTVKPVSSPLPTIATTGSISIVEPMIIKYYGNERDIKTVDAPLDTVTCKDRFGVADSRLTVDCFGNFLVIDILFRMLMPRELALAMSFPHDYRFAGSNKDIVKQIGNAVCPKLAEALIAAALPDLIKYVMKDVA